MWMDSSARHLAKGITPEDLELAPMLIKSAEKGARPDLPSKGEPLKPLVRDTSSDDEDEKAILRQMKEIDGLDWFSQFWLLYHRSVASRKFETLSVQKVVMIVGWSVVAGDLPPSIPVPFFLSFSRVFLSHPIPCGSCSSASHS